MSAIDLDQYEPLEALHEGELPAQSEMVITAEDGDDRTFRLLTPLKVNGEWLRIINIRLPTQADIDAWGNRDIVTSREFVCRLTGLDPRVVAALRWHDSATLLQLVQDIVPDFVKGD